jgi:hypothetical protein
MIVYSYNENNIIHRFDLQMIEIKDENIRDNLIKVSPHHLATIRIIERWKNNNQNDVVDYVEMDCKKMDYDDFTELLKAYINRQSKQSNLHNDYHWFTSIRTLDGENIILDPPINTYLTKIYSFIVDKIYYGTVYNYEYYLDLNQCFEIDKVSEKLLSFINKYSTLQLSNITFDEEDMDVVNIANFINSLKATQTKDIVGIPKFNKRTKQTEYYTHDYEYQRNIETAVANTKAWYTIFGPAIAIVNNASYPNCIEQDKLYYLHK